MQFRFSHRWQDEGKTILRYVAKSGWNWRDYHACARIATLTLTPKGVPVDILIDLTASEQMPSGMPAHTRTFGKRLVPALSGRAAVIGVPDADVLALIPDGSRILPTEDGQVYFAPTENDALERLAAWRQAPE